MRKAKTKNERKTSIVCYIWYDICISFVYYCFLWFSKMCGQGGIQVFPKKPIRTKNELNKKILGKQKREEGRNLNKFLSEKYFQNVV